MSKANKTRLLQIRCDDGFLELLDRRAGECGLDRTGYIKLVVTKSEVSVLRDGGTETKASIEREVRKEVGKEGGIIAELQAKVDGIKAGVATEYKRGDIFEKNEASEGYDRMRRATVAFCFQNDIADESLLNKAQKEFIAGNIGKLLGEVEEEAKVVKVKSKEEFKQIWLKEHGTKDLSMNHPSKFKSREPKKKGVKK